MAKAKKAAGELSKLEQHRAAVKAAMPDVEGVINRHSLSLVNSCLAKIRERNKLKKKADSLRKQIQEIEEKM